MASTGFSLARMTVRTRGRGGSPGPVSRFRSSPVLDAGSGSELRNHKGHWKHRFASVVQIEKFALHQAASSGEFLDHHTRVTPGNANANPLRDMAWKRPLR